MKYNNIQEIIKDFHLNSDKISDIKKELKSLIKEVHPDKNGGIDFKNKMDEINYHKLTSALEFISEERTLVVSKNELSTIINDLYPKQINQTKIIELKTQIDNEIREYKNSYLLPKISVSAITGIISFLWLFPNTIAEHPILSQYIDIKSIFFSFFWFMSLYITGTVWFFISRKERIMKNAIKRLNLEVTQNRIFQEAISLKKYSAEKEKIHRIEFTKDEIINYFSEINIRSLKNEYFSRKQKNILNSKQHIDIEIAQNLTDIILNRYLSKGIIKELNTKKLTTTYELNL